MSVLPPPLPSPLPPLGEPSSAMHLLLRLESLLSVSNPQLLRSSSASESGTGEYRKYRKPKIFPCQCLSTAERETEAFATSLPLVQVRQEVPLFLCPSVHLSVRPPFRLRVLVCVVAPLEARRRGGEGEGEVEALLGCLAQLYLLLDDPSRVVDERVNQAGDCREKRRTSGRRGGEKKKKSDP